MPTLLHRGCGTIDSIKRILKDIHDDYESLAKKIYEVIKNTLWLLISEDHLMTPYQLDLDGTKL